MALLGPLETPPLRAGRGFVAAVTALLVSGQGAIVGGRGILAATGALIYIAIAVVSVFFGKALDCDKLEVGMAGVPQGVIKLPAQTHSAEETAAVHEQGTPGTVILVFVFLGVFMLYYFTNWKLLSMIWKIG